MLIGIRRTQLLQIRHSRSRKSIVRKNRSRADHHAVFDGDAVTDVDVGIDFDSMTDLNFAGDHRLAADDAFVAQDRITPNMGVVPYGTEVDEERIERSQ